jgi:hypothetical protein
MLLVPNIFNFGLIRKSSGFSRGASMYRGVTRSHMLYQLLSINH